MAKTASMPFISGSTSSRSLTHTKNMNTPRIDKKSSTLNSKEIFINVKNVVVSTIVRQERANQEKSLCVLAVLKIFFKKN
ncbi:MAG: hypothetical protein NDI69_14735 [Bacteriovoracaceae bacterium]|nr:hypothetical protein [Bacteriovoracaceae bacterium]